MRKNIGFIWFFYIWRFMLFISRNHWFMLWVALEINTAIFVCIIYLEKRSKQIDAVLIYFLVQRLRSLVLIFSLFNIETQAIIQRREPKIFIMTALLLKIALAPLHSWFIFVVKICKNAPLYLILSLQKMIPFLIIISLKPKLLIIMIFFILFSTFWSPLINFTQNNIKNILALSSISHGRWMLFSTLTNEPNWIFYFSTYSFLVIISTKLLFNTISQNNLKKNRNQIKLTLLRLLALGGLPPLLGFFPKILVLTEALKLEIILVIFFLLLGSASDIYVYVRLNHLALLNKKRNILWLKTEKIKLITPLFLISSRIPAMWFFSQI